MQFTWLHEYMQEMLLLSMHYLLRDALHYNDGKDADSKASVCNW